MSTPADQVLTLNKGKSQQTTLTASTIADLIADAQQNPIRWIIPNVLLEGGLHIFHGKEESFKTMLTLQLHEVLAQGGEFLGREVSGGMRTGIVELEMKPRIFGHRLRVFFRTSIPNICVLPDSHRRAVLTAPNPMLRIKRICNWANSEGLEMLSIDSAIKLFPPKWQTDTAEQASDVLSQLQQLPTTWIIAHDRKSPHDMPNQVGNEEIVGSGRFAADPDMVHQVIRPDRRAPRAVFHWGKAREGEKSPPLELWFDKVDFRLYPIHPFLQLVQVRPMLEAEIIAEAEARYGWKERNSRAHIATLLKLKDAQGQPAVQEQMEAHSKKLVLISKPVPPVEENDDPLDV